PAGLLGCHPAAGSTWPPHSATGNVSRPHRVQIPFDPNADRPLRGRRTPISSRLIGSRMNSSICRPGLSFRNARQLSRTIDVGSMVDAQNVNLSKLILDL